MHTSTSRAAPARFIALVGDAELDEGNVWEAITDPALQGLGNVMLVVDTNRQSLDRVIPDQKIKKLMEFFDGAGWHVVEAKYGRAADARRSPGPAATRCARTSTRCRTRSTSRCSPTAAPSCASGSCAAPTTPCARLVADVADDELAPLVQNLGGHDLGVLLDAYRACDADDRPAERRVRLHRQGLGPADRRRPAEPRGAADRRRRSTRCAPSIGLTPTTEWDRFDPASPAGPAVRARPAAS